MFKLNAIVFIGFMFALTATGADHGPGNANSGKIDRDLLIKMILDESYNLKASMLNYLNAIKIDRIGNSAARETFRRIGKESLKLDIQRSTYKTGSDCTEQFLPAVAKKLKGEDVASATTGIGDRTETTSGDICFDVSQNSSLLKAVNNLSFEEAKKRLASLAFHEHVHHFQIDDPSRREANEVEAYELAAYVRASAKFAQVPLMTWGEEESLPFATSKKASADMILTTDIPGIKHGTQKVRVSFINKCIFFLKEKVKSNNGPVTLSARTFSIGRISDSLYSVKARTILGGTALEQQESIRAEIIGDPALEFIECAFSGVNADRLFHHLDPKDAKVQPQINYSVSDFFEMIVHLSEGKVRIQKIYPQRATKL